jgi:hypothetical protein
VEDLLTQLDKLPASEVKISVRTKVLICPEIKVFVHACSMLRPELSKLYATEGVSAGPYVSLIFSHRSCGK